MVGVQTPFSLGGSQLTGFNNRLYPSVDANAAPFAVDSGGISLLLQSGVQVLLQYNASTQQLQTVDTVTGQMSAAVTSFTALQWNNTNSTELVCSSPLRPLPLTAAVACPAGTMALPLGDTSLQDTATYYQSGQISQAGSLYTRGYNASIAGLTLYQLSLRLNDNPNSIFSMRMGLYLLSASDSLTQRFTLTLVAQTAELVLANPMAGVVTLDLLTPLALTLGQTYFMSWQADAPVSLPLSSWYSGFGWPTYSGDAYSSSGLPSTVSSTYGVQDALLIGGNSCVASRAVTHFSFCITVLSSYWTDQFWGSLSAMPAGQPGVYLVVNASGNATLGNWGWESFSLSAGSLGLPYSNLLYTAGGAPPVDGQGLSLYSVSTDGAYAVQTVIASTPISPSLYELQEQMGGNLQSANIVGSTFNLWPGVIPVSVDNCTAPEVLIALNQVDPPSAAVLSCDDYSGISVNQGDQTSADFPNLQGSISPNTVYSTPFTTTASMSVQQLGLSVMDNLSPEPVLLTLGLYSPGGVLLAQAPQLNLTQVYAQSVIVNLTAPVSISPGQYRIVLWSSSQLNISTGSSSLSAAAAAYGSSLPSTFTATASGPSLPLAAYGCTPPTHFFCGVFQYYAPAASNCPYCTSVSTAVVYSGALQLGAATTDSLGLGAPVLALSGYYYYSQPTFYSWMSLALAPGSVSPRVYSTGPAAFSTSGINLTASSYGTVEIAIVIHYNSSSQMLQEDSGSWGQPVFSNFTVFPLRPSGALPSCSFTSLPSSTAGSFSLPVCPAGSSAVKFGDDDAADQAYNSEGGLGPYSGVFSLTVSYIWFTPIEVTSPAQISHLSFGLLINYNTVANLKLALFSSSLDFLVQTNVVRLVNPTDQLVVAQLTAPYVLDSGTYYIGLWSDATLYSPFSWIAHPVACCWYGLNETWPVITANSTDYVSTDVAAYGCSVSQPGSSSGSSSTGGSGSGISGISSSHSLSSSSSSSVATAVLSSSPSSSGAVRSTWSSSSSGGQCACGGSSSSSSLSNGAIVGIVIGCAIGTLALGLLCIYCVLLTARDTKAQQKAAATSGAESSRVSMETVEMSSNTQQPQLSGRERVHAES